MDVPSADLLGLAERKLNWLQNRQQVLADNIANADTPRYRPRDEMPFESALSALTVMPVRTNVMHLAAVGVQDGTVSDRADGRAPDGNQISLETEMAKVADTESEQRFVTNLYAKYLSMFSIALGKG